MNPRVSKRGDRYIPELALAQGPVAIGTGSTYAELFGYIWAVEVSEADEVVLYQYDEATSAWDEKHTIADAPTPPEKMRHISLAFDQAARPIIAYEHKDTQQIYVRQWDGLSNTFVYRGPFDGVDPVLINDVVVHYQIGQSDILCYHLTKDRQTLVARVQSEQYGTQHDQTTFTAQVYLDQIASYDYRLAVVGSYCSDQDSTDVVLDTGPYPQYLSDVVHQSSYIAGTGNYIPKIVAEDVGTDNVAAASYTVGAGNYIPLTVIIDVGSDGVASVAYIVGNTDYATVVVVHDLTASQYTSPDAVTTASFIASTVIYSIVVVVHDLTASQYTSPDAVTSSSYIVGGGTYATA